MPAAAVAHGGGPTPVLNASLAGVVAEARRHSSIGRLYGAEFGLTGLLNERFFDLLAEPAENIAAIGASPGSALGSSRRKLTPEEDHRIFENLRKRDVRYLFYTGGNGSMDTASRLHQLSQSSGHEMCVIGIPKTIDNDIVQTDHTPGYGSCGRFFAHALRDIGADNQALPTPVCVVEVLGRNVGWVVAATAHARTHAEDAPHLIYFPEFGVSAEQMCSDVESVHRRLGRCVIAVCEGQTDEQGGWFGAELSTLPGASDALPANMGHALSRLIWSRTGLRARAEKPGLLGRSSHALVSEVDRKEAWLCGQAAVQAAVAGFAGNMVALRRVPGPAYHCETELVPLASVARIERTFPSGWITHSHNNVRPEFLEWSRPLIGEIWRPPFLSCRA